MARVRFPFVLLLGIAALTLTAPAGNAMTCRQAFAAARSGVTSYVHEVIASKGARLLVKPQDKLDAASSAYGFFRHEPSAKGARYWMSWLTLKPASYWLGSTLTGQNDVRLSVTQSLWDNLVDRPTHWVTRRFTAPEMRPAFLAKLPLILVWSLLANTYVTDPVSDFAFDRKMQWEITSHKSQFDDLIQNDFRFRAIREQLRSGEIGADEAEHSAYMITEAYAKYYAFRDERQGVFTEMDDELLLNQYLFIHLRSTLESGVQVPRGFAATNAYRAHVSLAQRDELFHQTHELYLQYQMTDVYVRRLSGQDSSTPDWLMPYLQGMRQDPFVDLLTQLRWAGRITAAQLSAYMMENYFWNSRLASWRTLGLERINPETGKPVVLADYQSEMLKEIRGATVAKVAP